MNFNIRTADDECYDFPPGTEQHPYKPVGMDWHIIRRYDEDYEMEVDFTIVDGVEISFSYEPSGIQVFIENPGQMTEERALAIVIAIGKHLAEITGQGASIPEYGLLIAPASPQPQY